MKYLLLILSAAVVYACSDDEKKVIDLRQDDEKEQRVLREPQHTKSENERAHGEPQHKGQTTGTEWTYKVVSISENNWGYQLFQNGTMKINQTSIPAVQGIQGFDSQVKAERTAKHIISKLEKGIFPPTVDKKELDSLKVLRN